MSHAQYILTRMHGSVLLLLLRLLIVGGQHPWKETLSEESISAGICHKSRLAVGESLVNKLAH